MTYTVKRLRHLGTGDENFLAAMATKNNEAYGNPYDWYDFDFQNFCDKHVAFMCYRDDVPVGIIAGRFGTSVFDPGLKVLRQTVFWTVPGTRAVKLLLEEFIDFGKSNADHILTSIGTETNLKPESLEKLGFKKLETLYRLEN